MSSHESGLSDLQLVKLLIELNGLSISRAAKEMGVQRSNLSSWLNGKPNVFSVAKVEGMLKVLGLFAASEALTGIRLRYLSPEQIHRWQVEAGAQSVIDVLRATESDSVLEDLEIFVVNTSQQGCFNILRCRKQDDLGWMMLVANRDSALVGYPLSPEILGFGKAAGTLHAPILKWMGWWKEKDLTVSGFGEEISGWMELDALNADHSDNPVEAELEACQHTAAQLQDIITELMNELLRVDPGNQMPEQIARTMVPVDLSIRSPDLEML